MSEKIREEHRKRGAVVYVRQSTMGQVRDNRESQRRQYGLVDRAHALGFRAVSVIDEDLGRSGSGSVERPGFERLVASVCRGSVGAVFAVEASRLARNNRDWHHLVDLCALTETLVIDHDGIYDSGVLNDRLLLGLKGTMSEFELGLIRQRSQEALRQMIARGEVLTEVPVGFVRTRDNRCEKSPDRRVQSAVEGVFAKFRERGSVRQVLLWYRQERIPLPCVRPATGGTEIAWQLPIYSSILSLLKNPTYAGAFVYGRRRTRTVVKNGRARKTSGHEVPRAEWTVLIREHHAGYISWDDYLRNQKQLETNAGMRGRMTRGAPKSGSALLAGLLRCRRCGRKLHVGYSGIDGRVPRYYCRGAHLNHGAGRCISFGGLAVDRAVVEIVVGAIEPGGVEAAITAAEKMAQDRDEKREALRLAVEQARYEADRARRQYDAIDPENRLVAAELERRWNETLTRLAGAEKRLQELPERTRETAPIVRERLLRLGEDLRAVWNHPKATASLKKRILRTVLDEIVVDLVEEPRELRIWLHWMGGVHTSLVLPRNRTGKHGRCTDRKAVDLVKELAQITPDSSIAAILNRLGYRTGAGNTWTESRVRVLRSYHKIPVFDETKERSWITMGEAASRLGISPTAVKRLLTRGILPGRQIVAYAPWVIQTTDLELPRVQTRVRAIHQGRIGPRTLPVGDELPWDSTT